MLVYADASPDNDPDGYQESPRYASFEVDAAFIERIKKLQQLIKRHKLCAVEEWYGVAWQNEYNFRMDVERLVVSSDDFHFSGSPKHSSYYITTSFLNIKEITKDFKSGQTVVYYGIEADEVAADNIDGVGIRNEDE